MTKKAENLMIVSWVIALVATLGSLYFSEIRWYEPCKLCWVQRIFMYPIVIVLAIGIILKDRTAFIYSAFLSAIGIIIAVYHYSLQKVPFMQAAEPSCGQVSCTGAYINWLGFITIPFLAGTAFIAILLISLYALKNLKGEN